MSKVENESKSFTNKEIAGDLISNTKQYKLENIPKLNNK